MDGRLSKPRFRPFAVSAFAAAGVFWVTVLFQLPFFDLWFSFMDEGHMVQFADLRLRGGEFYRDATFYPLPGAFHFLAFIFDLFGASLRISRWVVVFEFALFVALLFYLIRKVTSTSWAVLGVGLLWIYRIWCFPHWQIYSYSTTALLVLLASAVALVVYFEGLQRRFLLLSGFLFGLGVLCKQDYGAAAMVALLASLALFILSLARSARPSLPSALAGFLGPAVLVGALTGLYYWRVGVLGDLLQFTVFNHFIGMEAYEYSEFPSLWPLFGQDLALRTTLGITEFMPGIVLTADWASLRIHPLFTDTPLYDVALKMFFFFPQLLLAAFGLRLWILRSQIHAPQGSSSRRRYLVEFLVFSFATSFLLLVWLNKPQDYVHLAVLYWPVIVLGLFLAQATLAGRPRRLLAAGAVVALPMLLVIAYSGRLIGNLRAEHSALLASDRGGVRVKPAEAEMMEGVLAYVAANTEPGDRVAGLPYFPLANFLSERPGPHRSAYIVWPFPEIANRDQKVVDAMEATGTDLVLYNFTQFFSFDPVWEHAPLLFAYLVENFEIDEIFSFDVAGYKPAALTRQRPEDREAGKAILSDGIDGLAIRVDGVAGPPRVIPPESRDQYVQEMLWPFRPAVALRPSSSERRSVLAIPLNVPSEGGSLRTAVAVHPQRWFKLPASWVEFRLAIRTSEGVQSVYERRLHPTHRLEDRGWFEVSVDLGPWAGQAVTLELSTGAENAHGSSLWSGGWARPRLLAPHEAPGESADPG